MSPIHRKNMRRKHMGRDMRQGLKKEIDNVILFPMGRL